MTRFFSIDWIKSYGNGYERQRRRIILGAVAGGFLCLAGGVGGTAAAEPQPLDLLILGDSLTAGYGLDERDAFPARLAAALEERGYPVTIVVSSVSGDTTAGGLARLGWALGADPDAEPDAVMVQLGGNDALRGIDPAATYDNLDAILTQLADRDIPTLLTGMLAPPNMGGEYTERFNAAFPRLAEEHDVIFYPFFLEGVAAQPALNQPDGIHPNAAGVDEIVRRITPYVIDVLERARSANGAG